MDVDSERQNPEISVIVPTRDRPEAIKACTDALVPSLSRTGAPSEIIVVQNGVAGGAADATSAVEKVEITGDGVTVREITLARGGVSHARNEGASLARGGILAFVDDDVRVAEDWGQAVSAAFARGAETGILVGRVLSGEARQAALSERAETDPCDFDWTRFWRFTLGCCCWRRSAWDVCEGYDERMGPGRWISAAEDAEIIFRAARRSVALAFDPSIVAYHHHGRADAAVVERMRRAYTRGRGAFYAKHCLRGDREAMRLLYWDLKAAIRRVAENGVRQSKGDLRWLMWLLDGFCRGIARALFI